MKKKKKNVYKHSSATPLFVPFLLVGFLTTCFIPISLQKPPAQQPSSTTLTNQRQVGGHPSRKILLVSDAFRRQAGTYVFPYTSFALVYLFFSFFLLQFKDNRRLKLLSMRRQKIMAECNERLRRCSEILSKGICTDTSLAFYLWARKQAQQIMNEGNIKCPPSIVRFLAFGARQRKVRKT